MNRLSRIVVVGVSVAGLTVAETLRQHGFTDSLTLVGEERRPPYDRPPLSKQILRGTWEPDRVALRSHDTLSTLGADWLLGIAAIALDTSARKLTLSDGSVLAYDGLVIATGVTPRRLPAGHELSGVHVAATGRFAGLYGTDGHVTGAVTWNLPRQARNLRRYVAERTPWRQALQQASCGGRVDPPYGKSLVSRVRSS
ncbi:FAD-dependent oxidoreductase [Nonomuraea sp. NPDC005983]|uniref:FAD-dependent oxidoreductase n=1 Tax=Nonomuraea sp. NPDC005983 TaxID=3155595 RepID=UPI0033B105D8